jgi:MFS family permease
VKTLQRRTLATLMAGQAAGYAALTISLSIVALLTASILGDDRLGGLPAALLTLSTAGSAAWLARRSLRRGRRRALVIGYLLGAGGGLAAAAAGDRRSLAVLLMGMVAFGVGQAANLQTRYAATDLADPGRRAQSIALVVWVGTIGAVAGPFLVEAADSRGLALGLRPYVGPMLLSGLCFLLAAAVVAAWLRPDPLEVAGGVDPLMKGGNPFRGVAGTIRLILDNPSARMALMAMVVTHVAMVSVMVMTPPHLRDHGHAGLAGPVIGLHVLGMFGLSPVIGRWADRVGSLRMIQIGGLVLAAGTVASVVAGYHPSLIFVGLFLLGLGYSFGFISGSALLTAAVPPQHRVAAQGAGDLTVSTFSAVAALGSGLVKQAAGFHWLANLATTMALMLVVTAVAAARRAPVTAR